MSYSVTPKRSHLPESPSPPRFSENYNQDREGDGRERMSDSDKDEHNRDEDENSDEEEAQSGESKLTMPRPRSYNDDDMSSNIDVHQYSRQGSPAPRPAAKLPKWVKLDVDPKPIPTMENTYRHPEQDEMLDALELTGLANLIKTANQIELRRAPSAVASPLLVTDNMVESLGLLASVEETRLRSLLSNTYVYDSLSGKWDNEPEKALDRHSGPYADAKNPLHRFDPGIYVNWLMPADGVPLTVAEFRIFLDAMNMTVGESGAEDQNKDKFRFRGKNLGWWVRYHYAEIAGVHPYVDASELLPSDDPDGPTVPEKSRSKQAEEYWSSFPLSDHKDQLRPVVYQITKFWEQVLDHLDPRVKFVAIPPEVGWSKYLLRGLGQHAVLRSGPEVFKLMNCVLRCIFPHHRFRMHQYVVARATEWSHAAIGESLVSQICASYVTYGGPNVAQASKSIESALQATPGQWIEVQNFITAGKHFSATTMANLKKAEQILEERTRAVELEEQFKSNATILQEQSNRLNEAEAELARKHAEMHQRLDVIQNGIEELDAKRARAEKQEAASRLLSSSLDEMEQAIKELEEVL